MLYLLLALVNILLFIFFTVICIKAIVLVRREITLFAAIVFTIGLLSFTCNSNTHQDNVEPGTNQVKTWKFTSPDSLEMGSLTSIDIDLEKTLISTYTLSIRYGKYKQQKNTVPVNANTYITGWQAGTSWKPEFILVNSTNDNQKLEYEVGGIVTWKLLGITFYSESKNWKGTVLLK